VLAFENVAKAALAPVTAQHKPRQRCKCGLFIHLNRSAEESEPEAMPNAKRENYKVSQGSYFTRHTEPNFNRAIANQVHDRRVLHPR
jgi:hypothetical protein